MSRYRLSIGAVCCQGGDKTQNILFSFSDRRSHTRDVAVIIALVDATTTNEE